MNKIKPYREILPVILRYLTTFLKWLFLSCLVGGIGGLVGTLFHISVEYATTVRETHHLIIWLLPIGGVIIVFMYHICHINCTIGTNHVISSVRSNETVPILMAPLIFISTVITHLCGGSAGREGAALQLGGSIGSQVGHLFRLDEKDIHLITLCGMSSVFSALFGTPLTATLFAMEVISVGVLYYSALVPCLMSALTAFYLSLWLGMAPTRFVLSSVPEVTFPVILQIMGLSVLCAFLSIVFCVSIHGAEKWLSHFLSNEYLRIIAGGALLIFLTYLVGAGTYNGSGMDSITLALRGTARPEAFALKLLFTVITISAGYKGGEIVPTFFIGATFGCFFGGLLGLDPTFGAAIGLVALFCGVVNCPVASIVLSIELFGAGGLLLFAIACGISYVLSGYYGLYSSQKILYSKVKAEFIDINTK